MIQIVKVETFLVDVPAIRPHVLAMTTMHAQALCIVKIHCSDGVVGIGEAATIGGLAYGPESPESIKLTIDTYFKPILRAGDPTRIASLMGVIGKHVVGNHFAKCAVETALLDAQGKRLNLPISELLGGRVRDQLSVLWTLASGETATDIDEAEAMIASGRHNNFKLKIGKRALRDDVAHVAAIKAALGDRASVRVDVNMAWDEITARQAIQMLADVGCDLVEQPISRHNRDGMARLAEQSTIPIMADEALQGPASAFDYAAAHAANVFAVKVEQSGGLFAACEVQAIAKAAGIAVYGGTMLEASVSTAASAHVFSTAETLPYGTELFGPLLLTEEILAEPLDYHDFHLTVPNGAGLGIELDDDRIRFLRRDKTHSTHFTSSTGYDSHVV